MAAKLGNLNLFVRDVAVSRRFYVEGLGLTEIGDADAPANFCRLDAGGGCALMLQDASAPEAVFGSSDSVEIGFEVDDVAAAAAKINTLGGTVGNVQTMGWGSGADARDPDGYRLTLYKTRDRG